MTRGMRLCAAALAALVAASVASAAADEGWGGAKLNRENEPGATRGDNGRDDVREVFKAKVAEVDDYMEGHNVVNTPAEELKTVIVGFGKDFEALAAQATGDEELVARCRLAVEVMALYVESLDGPDVAWDLIDRAVEAEAKWKQARGTAPGRRRFMGTIVGSFMTGSESTTATAILASLGFRTSDLFALGPGVGFQDYENATSIPIFLSMRYNFTPGQVSPLGYGRVGYNKAKFKEIGYPFTGKEDPSGMFFGLGGGLDVVTRGGFGLTLEVGGRVEITYKYIVYIYPGGRVSPVEKRQETLGFVRFGLGAVF